MFWTLIIEFSCNKITEYIKKQFDDILAEESRVRRNPHLVDNRIHVALYFISATGHGLRELDIDFMKTISAFVNVIPVISKADTLTSNELEHNKNLIMCDIRDYNIPIYYFPCEPNDEEAVEECATLRGLVPFAIVGSNALVPESGDYIRVREYPWGTVKGMF